DRELLLCACWLHDAGLYTPSRDPYVTEGARLAARVLAPAGRPSGCSAAWTPASSTTVATGHGPGGRADAASRPVDSTAGIVNFGLDRRWLRALFRDVSREGSWRLVGRSARSEFRHRPAGLTGVFFSPAHAIKEGSPRRRHDFRR